MLPSVQLITERTHSMRIAHVSAVFPPYESGTGRVCYFNALELARLGHAVTVFTAPASDDVFDDTGIISVRRLPAPIHLGNAPFMPQLITELRGFDIIHLHFPFIFGAELTWLASKLRGIPYVMTHHNDLITVGNRKRQLLFDLYYPISKFVTVRGASKYAVVSLDHAQHCGLTSTYKRRWSDVVEIPNGVETSLFYPNDEGVAIRSRWGIEPSAPVIGFVGTLDKAHMFKGVDKLIAAFAKLKNPHARLLIVGDGEMRQSYEQLARETGIAEQVVFSGNVPHEQLRAYYGASDIVVLPSTPPESFGMVLIEANACGRPVVASDIPGVRSVVSDGTTGFLFQAGDEDDLAAKLQTLIDSPELRSQFGQAGLRKVTERYSWAAIAKELEALYQLVLEEKHALPSHSPIQDR